MSMKVEDSTLAVVRALERMGVKHYVTGAGELPRSTNDAGVVAVLHSHQHRRLQQELGERFHVDEEDFRHATQEHRSFNLIDEVELARVDVFCVAPEGYQAEALARAAPMELEADDPFSAAHVAPAADVILSKLRWYRLGGETSDRQ